MSKKVFVGIVMILLTQVLIAQSIDEAFAQYKKDLSQIKDQPLNAMREFKPEQHFKNYTQNPSEAQLYKGIEAEKTDLKERALSRVQEDETSKIILREASGHHFEKNDQNPAIAYAKSISAQSEKLFSQGGDCENTPKTCENITHFETCLVSKSLPDKECIRKRVVNVDKEHRTMHIDVEVMVHKNWKGSIDVNLIQGWGRNTIYTRVSQPIRFEHGCHHINMYHVSIRNNRDWATWVNISRLPNCEGTFSLWVGKSFKRDYPVQISFEVDLESGLYEASDKWEDSCTNTNLGLCHLKDKICLIPNATRTMNGLDVTRDCWEERQTYACSYSNADNCESQKSKGCLQVNSSCNQFQDGICIEYKQSYSCNDTICKQSIPCIKKVFCADGTCSPRTPSENDSFADNISKLAVLGAAAEDFQKTQASIFKGRVVQCKALPLNFIDCCSSKGWGKALNFAHCSEEDKDLGMAKQNYLDHYLGRFCAKKELGLCLEYKRTYCVFDSKIARILQEGRLKQVSPDVLGTAESPTCSGMSVDELTALDFKEIEFVKPIYPSGYKQKGEPNSDAGILITNPNMNPDEMIRRVKERVTK
ncbi:MAG: type-F conjugative transfer system mating-pair stabilization protein TraN [Legionella sp.]|nr:MAG: type-F conjugative transfer system mating-pair stabilization protein TraN [Legionella sp.]